MRILITNDDGINAPGLQVLHEIATEIAGATGEVWTVAPAFEQSGVGHCISYTHPMMIAKLAPRRYAAEGSPADCVPRLRPIAPGTYSPARICRTVLPTVTVPSAATWPA